MSTLAASPSCASCFASSTSLSPSSCFSAHQHMHFINSSTATVAQLSSWMSLVMQDLAVEDVQGVQIHEIRCSSSSFSKGSSGGVPFCMQGVGGC